MSLQEVNVWSIVWKQFQYKWQSNKDMLTGLAIFQAIGLFLSATGGTFHHDFGFEFHWYTSDLLVVFAMIWLIVISVQILRPTNRLSTHIMVANRTTDHLSNILWLLVISVIATIVVLLSSVLLQIIMRYIASGIHLSPELHIPFWEYMMGVGSIYLYVLLAGAVGYFFGILSQWNGAMVIVIPVVLIGGLLIAPIYISEDLLIGMFSFLFLEQVFYLFTIKVIALIVTLFVLSIAMGNRLEVRK